MTQTCKANHWNKVTVLFLAALFFIPGIAGAFGGGYHHGKGQGRMMGGQGPICGIWRDSNMIKALDLTDDQVARIKELDFSQREKQVKTKNRIQELKLELDKKLAAEKVDKDSVRSLSKQISSLRGEQQTQRIETQLEIKEILNTEQYKKMETYRMGKRFKGPGMGRGNRQGGYCSNYSPYPTESIQP